MGRTAERARLRRLLDSARAGCGGALVLRGEPGIGKTALLEDLETAAGGMRVLRAWGVESESRLAFAGLADLLRPVLDRVDRIPEAQQAALRAALALGPPVGADRFAAYTATLSLLGAAASEDPLLVVIDDAHWLDVPSQEALLFCARRIEDEPIAMVAASRERHPEHLDVSGIPELRVGGLSEEPARGLLARVAGPLAAPVAERILSLAEGNPLALCELPWALSVSERAGEAALPHSLRPGEALTRAYRRRLEELDPGSRRAALLAFVSEDGVLGPILTALAAAGAGAPELERAEAAGVLTLEPGRATPRHPLLRAIALDLCGPAARRAAHRALAECLDPESHGEQRAWHLAEAAVGPDEQAAAALESAAMAAAARTGYAAAASALERAASLSGNELSAWRRRATAAQIALAAGHGAWAGALLGSGPDLPGGPLGFEIAHLRGRLGFLTGHLDTAVALLTRDAERIAIEDPARASRMLADATVARALTGDCYGALRTAERAYALALDAGDPDPAVIGHLAAALVLSGEARRARPLFERYNALVSEVDLLSPAGQMAMFTAAYETMLGDLEAVAPRIERWIAYARKAGAVGFVAYPLAIGCQLDFFAGRWARALARGQEATALLAETAGGPLTAINLAILGSIAAGTGATEAAQARVSEALRFAERDGVGCVRVYAAWTLGFMRLGMGEPERCVAALEPLVELVLSQGQREPLTVPWWPDLVEGYARLGCLGEARRVLALLSEQAHRTGGVWARAVTCRGRGLIDEDIDRHFGEALALHALTPMPFERARTQLAYGTRLRRAGRRTEARAQLEGALSTFEELGADPWTRQAREGIAASGARLRRRHHGPSAEELSPRELQVSLAVASGLTNRETAARLFLSEKTVERHLGSVYRKLGLRSRTELAARMARENAGAGRGGSRESPRHV